MFLVAAAATAIQIVLIPPSSSCAAERDDHWCGQYRDGTWATCTRPGHCCGLNYYCGDGYKYCSRDYCRFQCTPGNPPPAPPPPPGGGYDQSNNYEVTDQAGGGVLVTRLVNATHNNRYFNLNIGGGDELGKVATDNASSSSSSQSSSSSLLSCARSLSRLPLASRHKYPFAALSTLPQPHNNVTATRCGRCLKVTNVGVGELLPQVKVRIVHEHSKEGLELDLNTFKKLDINGRGIAKGMLLVKYQFESC
ncbi:unnamed protein product [Linum tenue]|uniref:Barwin domain-containing protein n=1 Tax=Linum tenue TaxID=586396 RepID=A0AAV0JLI4_9ROSI|nr:unnamed protein product [Linum tenue]